MNLPSGVAAAPVTNTDQCKSIVSLSPLSDYFRECLATVGAEATLQLLLELYRRTPTEEADWQTIGDPLEPYARETIGTGYAAEFLI